MNKGLENAWIFNGGEWMQTVDPVMNRPEAATDLEEAIKAVGYTAWTRVGKENAVPLILTVWSRSESPEFLFDIEGPMESQWVYADTLPDALALLNQLAPMLQALTITDQIARAEPKSMSVLADVLDKLHHRDRDRDGRIVKV